MSLPKNLTYRREIIRSYIRNLQGQLPIQTSSLSEKTMRDLEFLYTVRKRSVVNYCKTRKRPLAKPEALRRQISVLAEPNVLYCAVPKAGSTFWRRVLVALRRRKPEALSPFLYSYPDFNSHNFAFDRTLTHPGREHILQNIIDSSLKFFFTRDPYHRLFSTYVDKIFAPNTVFWKREARRVAQKVRRHDPSTTGCGQDITFVELVRYLNSLDPKKFNEHMLPTAQKCDLCRINYDVIGKMETFYYDVSYILKRTAQLGNHIIFHNFETEYKVDFLIDAIVRAFALKHEPQTGWINCLSSHAGNQRIWRQLQIAGLIDKASHYPLTPPESNSITVTTFINMALRAFQESTPEARGNKRQAYLQAYGQLSRLDLEGLREKYLEDFTAFGYDDRPEELFGENRDFNRNGFDYFDLLKVT